MEREHCSFLVRCWRRRGSARRFTIEHIQSGERTVVGSTAAAAAWISDRCGGVDDRPPPVPTSHPDPTGT